MLERWLAVLTGTAASGWRRWAWLAFFGLAPVAFFVGLELHEQNARRRAERFADPARMLEQAHAAAAAEGFDTRSWKAIQQVIISDPLQQFQRRNEVWAGMPAKQRRLVPRTWVRVILEARTSRSWFAVWLRPDASVFAFDSSPGLVAPRNNVTEEQARELARVRFERMCAGRELDMGEPEVQSAGETGAFAARRFVWRGQFPGFEGLGSTCTVEVLGDRVRSVSSDFNWAQSVGRSATAQAFMQVRSLIILLLFLYGIYRFSRRALEREVPWSRCIIIFSVMIGFGLFLQLLNPNYASGGLSVSQVLSSTSWIIVASVMVSFALQGMILALGYGASEGELRETYPGKLTAWDALLTGRLWSRNVGTAILFGGAAGAWAIFARAALWEGFGLSRVLNEQNLIFTYGPVPWLMQMINEPLAAMFLVTSIALLPLMFANRNVANRLARRVVVIVLAFFGSTAGSVWDIEAAGDVVGLLAIGALVLAAFWYRDLLASVVAVVTLNTFGLIKDFGATVPVWQEYFAYALLLGGATLLAAVVMVARAREVKDEEVRPVYAKRLQERLLMQTEVSAAREAQLRLMPEHPPEIPGLRIEASCQPAREVGGDFYDFLALSRGRLGILAAEGGSAGLASALTIGLAKGFLLYAARRDWPVAEALRRLSPILREATHQTIERLGLAYVTVDPATRAVSIGRLGVHPRLFRLSESGGAEVTLFEVVGGERLAEARLTLAPGESLLLLTDGIEKRLRAQRNQSIEQWVAQVDGRVVASAEAICQELFRQSAGPPGELDDDLTAVVLRFDRAPVRERVGVA